MTTQCTEYEQYIHVLSVCVCEGGVIVGRSVVMVTSLSLSLSPLTDSSQPSLAQPSLTLQSFPYGGCESVELSYQSGMCAEHK